MANAIIWAGGIFLALLVLFVIYVMVYPSFKKKETGISEVSAYRGYITIISKYGIGRLKKKEIVNPELKTFNLYQVKPNDEELPSINNVSDAIIKVLGKGEKFEVWIIGDIFDEGDLKRLSNEINNWKQEADLWKRRALMLEAQEEDSRDKFIEDVKEIAKAKDKPEFKKPSH